jgi:hypothetical protein
MFSSMTPIDPAMAALEEGDRPSDGPREGPWVAATPTRAGPGHCFGKSLGCCANLPKPSPFFS